MRILPLQSLLSLLLFWEKVAASSSRASISASLVVIMLSRLLFVMWSRVEDISVSRGGRYWQASFCGCLTAILLNLFDILGKIFHLGLQGQAV